VLFGKLQQGVQENQQVLTIARQRADAEDAYGVRLGEIVPAADRISGGFTRDDGASVRKVSDPSPDFHTGARFCRLIPRSSAGIRRG
jgi:hypothetical protein